MASPSPEAIGLVIAVTSAAIGAVLYGLRRLRYSVSRLRVDLRTATARARISDVLLAGGSDALAAALPAVGLLADGVTAIYPVTTPGNRSRLLVAAPPDRTDPAVRAAAALLAAVSVSAAEVPELDRAVRSGLPQRGLDVGSLLRRGGTSLPYATRDKLFERLARTPFLVVPIARPGGVVAGLLLALGEKDDLDGKALSLGRVTSRLAMLLPPPRKGPARAQAGGRVRPAPSTHPAAPHDADAVLWLDNHGEVASCEMLQNDWAVAPPGSLQELFGGEGHERLLERASGERPVALGLARLGEDTLVEVSLLRLADGDENTWGYAAFLRRVGVPAAGEREEPSPSSRSASLLR